MTPAPYQVCGHLPPEDLAALRDDIAARGVLVPVEVDEHGDLLDGHHRVAICAELGIRDYPRIVRSGMTHAEKIAHARALNTLRRHMTREDRARQVAALSAEGWSNRRIARATGLSEPTVRRDLSSARPEGTGATERVTGTDGRSYPARRTPTSVLAIGAAQERRARRAVTDLEEEAPPRFVDLRRAEVLARTCARRLAGEAAAGPVPASVEVHHCDVADLPVAPGSADLVFTDPPYDRAGMATYERLAERAAVWLRPGDLLVAYAGQMYLPTAMQSLARHLDYWWTFAVVHERQVAQVRQRHLGSAWRPVLVYRKPGDGHSLLPPFTVDVNKGGGSDKRLHGWQQGEAEAEQWLRHLTVPGDLIVDPFAGSGTTAAAALGLGRRCVTGDIDVAAVAVTTRRLAGARHDDATP